MTKHVAEEMEFAQREHSSPPSESSKTKGAARLKKPIHLLEGVRDVLPQEQMYFRMIREKIEDAISDFDYQWIDLPMIERASLFHRAQSLPSVESEEDLIAFSEGFKEKIALRPAALPQLLRAYVEHGMVNMPVPLKLAYDGPFFSRRNPWGGRWKQFYEMGFEIIGEKASVIEAEMILMASGLCDEWGVKTSIQITSLGCGDCRLKYLPLLRDYYRSRKKFLCEACKLRLTKTPFELIACSEIDCHELAQDAPQLVDHLCEDCRKHFVGVLEHLDAAELTYTLNPKIVRGVGVFMRTLVELWPEHVEGKGPAHPVFRAGRHHEVFEEFGAPETPGLWGAFGVERLVQIMRDQNVKPAQAPRDLFVAQLGEGAKKKALKLFRELRREGFRVSMAVSKDGLQPQLAAAVKQGVQMTLILGQKEIIDGTALLRDMHDSSQEVIDFNKIISVVRKRLAAKKGLIEHAPIAPMIEGVKEEEIEAGAEEGSSERLSTLEEPVKLAGGGDLLPEGSSLPMEEEGDPMTKALEEEDHPRRDPMIYGGGDNFRDDEET